MPTNSETSNSGTTDAGVKVIIVLVVVLVGFIGTQLCGFEFAPDAGNTFITSKLPVLFLVALLIERTAEVFLTIWRSADSLDMQKKLKSLTDLKEAKDVRAARLTELEGKIKACDAAIAAPPDDPDKREEIKLENAEPERKKAELELKKAELKKAQQTEDIEFDALQKIQLTNGQIGTVENRTEQIADYKNRTRSLAFGFNFILALFVAGCGFRAVEGLVNLRPVDAEAPAVAAAFDKAQIEKLADDLTKKIGENSKSLAKLTDDVFMATKKKREESWARWVERNPEIDDAKIEEVTNGITKKISDDRESFEKRRDATLTETKKEQDAAWVPWLKDNLKSLLVNASPKWQLSLFRFFDILLTAGLLAGGADPISRMMKLLRDFLDQSSKRAEKKATD